MARGAGVDNCRVPSQRPSPLEGCHGDAVRAASVLSGQAGRLENGQEAGIGESVTETRVQLGVAPQSLHAVAARERVITKPVYLAAARANPGNGHLEAHTQPNDDGQLGVRQPCAFAAVR